MHARLRHALVASPRNPLHLNASQIYAVVLELCLRTIKSTFSGGRKDDLLSQWYTSLPPQALSGPGSRKLHLGALKYLVKASALPCLIEGRHCNTVGLSSRQATCVLGCSTCDVSCRHGTLHAMKWPASWECTTYGCVGGHFEKMRAQRAAGE